MEGSVGYPHLEFQWNIIGRFYSMYSASGRVEWVRFWNDRFTHSKWTLINQYLKKIGRDGKTWAAQKQNHESLEWVTYRWVVAADGALKDCAEDVEPKKWHCWRAPATTQRWECLGEVLAKLADDGQKYAAEIAWQVDHFELPKTDWGFLSAHRLLPSNRKSQCELVEWVKWCDDSGAVIRNNVDAANGGKKWKYYKKLDTVVR